jgi:hypothetical protein
MRRAFRLLLPLAIITAAVGACSGSSGSSTNKTADDQAAADAAVLQSSDLPAAFTEKSSASSSTAGSSSDDVAQSSFDTCLGNVAGVTSSEFEKDRTAKAKRTFRTPALDVEGEVELYGDAATVQRQIEVTRDDAAIQCLADAIKQSADDPRFAVESVTPLPRPPTPSVGERQSAMALVFVLSNGSQLIEVNVTSYLAQQGRALVTLTLTSVNAEATTASDTAALVQGAMQAMINRLP